MNTELPAVGLPRDRVDGRLKITGAARYSADWPAAGLTYAFMVLSSVASGRIAHIDTDAASRQAGVLAILTHRNAPRVHVAPTTPLDRYLMVLQDDVIHYDRQPVAVVVADSFARAKYAASLVSVRYAGTPARTRLAKGIIYAPKIADGHPPVALRGDAQGMLAQAALRVDQMYTTPVEHHNPMEPHATIAAWDGDRLTVHDANQGVSPVAKRLAGIFGITIANVHVITKFTGGAFGSKGTTWPHTVLAAMAAKLVKRPVQLNVWRPQMWGSVGYRPATRQRVALGSAEDGKLAAQIHETLSQTSMNDDFTESSGMITKVLYPSPALRVTHMVSRVNYGPPVFMRAPGEATGSFALESAMDELSYAAGIDPIELRLRNYAEIDPTENKPFSSKSLRECYARGAEMIGWKTRTAQPRSMRDGRYLLGMGMATATYPTNQSPASAVAHILPDGTAVVQSAGVDLGTGAYTAFTQIAAAALGLPVEKVTFNLGDSNYPNAPVAGGSQLTASVGSAVQAAATTARMKVAALAVADPNSPMHGVDPGQIEAVNGRLFVRGSSRGETFAAVLARNGNMTIVGSGDAKPDAASPYSANAFGAQFVTVRVDPDLGTIRIAKQVGAFAAGRIINAKTARSQYLGGMVMGLGMALLEESRPDLRTGRFMNANLGEYLVPVHADVGAMNAIIVEEDDPHVNPVGVKGIGEIGIVGVAAAVANAVFHATGKRVRDLPITPDKIFV